MKISQLTLSNFRQFYGRQTLGLAYDDELNVTVVHAENGVGKTTLLNAIYWTFFGDVTSRFEHPDMVLNFAAAGEGASSAAVDVAFEVDASEYVAQRRWRQATKAAELKVAAVHQGAMRPLPAPETFMNSVIPREMARYFFFDGEHAETFSAAGNSGAGAAIRNMLGCDLAERAIADLASAAGHYTRQVGTVPGEDEARRLQELLDRLERDRERDELTLADHRRSIDELRAQKGRIEEELRQTAGAREIQKRRDDLGLRLGEVAAGLAEAEADVVRWVGLRGIGVAARRLASETLDFIDEQALRGRIPSPYNETFIQGLLQQGRCICGCELEPQSPEWAAVADLLRTAGNPVALQRVFRARARLTVLKEAGAEAPRVLASHRSRAAHALEQRRALEQQIGELGESLKNFSLDEVREREEARLKVERRVEGLNRDAARLEVTMAQRAREIADRTQEIERIGQRNARARGFLARSRLAKAAAESLRDKLSAYEVEARAAIEEDINGILGRVARRDYAFRFAQDFGMSLVYGTGGVVPRSGGENQLLSLAFTAALLRFAKGRVGARDAVLSPGTVAPLVLDAPFGQLDKRYKAATAAFVPDMAGQVVLLLSSSQASPEVMEALGPRIGAEYVLISDNVGRRGEKGDDAIVLGGREYVRSRFNQERNQTVVERVR